MKNEIFRLEDLIELDNCKSPTIDVHEVFTKCSRLGFDCF